MTRLYGEGREPIPPIGQATVIFMINKSLPRDSCTDQDVYQATRCAWRIANECVRLQAVYALGVSHGVVRGAYRIEQWHPPHDGRWCFDGSPGTELGVVGTSVARLKGRQGNANPVRPFLEWIPAIQPDNE